MSDLIENASYDLLALYHMHPAFALSGYALFFLIASSLGIPGLRLFIIIAAGIMGPWAVTIISSLTGAAGTLAGYYAGGYLLRNFISKRYQDKILEGRRRIGEEGLYYLFALRAAPITPNIMTSLVFGTLRYPAPWTFVWVGSLAMTPSILIHAMIGAVIFNGTLAPSVPYTQIMFALSIMAVMPLFIRKLVWRIRLKRKPPIYMET